MDSPILKNDLDGVLTKIGSRSFLEPVSLLILVLPSMVILSVFGSQSTTAYQYWVWFEANMISIGVASILIWVLRLLWGKYFESFVFPFWAVVLLSAFLGFIKSFLTATWVVNSTGLATLSNGFVNIVIAGTISAIPALILCSAIVLLLGQFRLERDLLITAKSLEQLRRKSSQDKQQLSNLSASIRELIADLKSGRKQSGVESKSLIRNLVDQHVRPLASSLFADLERENQSFAIRELFLAAMKQAPSAIAPALMVLFVIPRSTDWFGEIAGPVSILVLSMAFYLSIRLSNAIAKKLNLAGPLVFLTISIIVPLAVVMAATYSFDVLQGLRWTIPIIVVAWFGQLAVLVVMSRVALTTASNNRAEVEELLGANNASELALLNRQRRELANQLHGEIQSRLMTISLKNTSSSEFDNEVTIQELTQIAELIDRGPKQNLSFDQSIERLKRLWARFVELEIEIDKDFNTEGQENLVYSIIEEGVSNALKHGLANEVKIQLLKHGKILITDNGIGPTKGTAGLGSRLIQSGSDQWSLTPGEDGGSVLLVQLASESRAKI